MKANRLAHFSMGLLERGHDLDGDSPGNRSRHSGATTRIASSIAVDWSCASLE